MSPLKVTTEILFKAKTSLGEVREILKQHAGKEIKITAYLDETSVCKCVYKGMLLEEDDGSLTVKKSDDGDSLYNRDLEIAEMCPLSPDGEIIKDKGQYHCIEVKVLEFYQE